MELIRTLVSVSDFLGCRGASPAQTQLSGTTGESSGAGEGIMMLPSSSAGGLPAGGGLEIIDVS